MAKGINRLSDRLITTRRERGMYSDGGGLYLNVSKTGSRSWIFRYASDGRQHDIGLGAYPAVGLADAREKAAALQAQRASGIDPLRAKAHKVTGDTPSFRTVAEQYIRDGEEQRKWSGRRTAEQWLQSLRQHAFPVIGELECEAVDTAAVLRVIKPLWAEKRETGDKVRARIATVLGYAMTHGYCQRRDNPAAWQGNLEHAGLASADGHKAFEMVKPADLPAFMAALRSAKQTGRAGEYTAQAALELVVLTAVRAGEATGATWAEIDRERKTWTIPAARMKMRRDHVVPLSDAALALLARLPQQEGLLFPGADSGSRMDNGRMREALAKAKAAVGLDYHATVHGFRHTFSSWANETGSAEPHVIEMALAHKQGGVAGVYNHATYVEQRARLLQRWADYCAGGETAANVVPLRAINNLAG